MSTLSDLIDRWQQWRCEQNRQAVEAARAGWGATLRLAWRRATLR